jgi:uncharacterized membrane protein
MRAIARGLNWEGMIRGFPEAAGINVALSCLSLLVKLSSSTNARALTRALAMVRLISLALCLAFLMVSFSHSQCVVQDLHCEHF